MAARALRTTFLSIKDFGWPMVAGKVAFAGKVASIDRTWRQCGGPTAEPGSTADQRPVPTSLAARSEADADLRREALSSPDGGRMQRKRHWQLRTQEREPSRKHSVEAVSMVSALGPSGGMGNQVLT